MKKFILLIQICVLFVAGCVTTHKCKELKETSLEFLSEDKYNDKGTNFDLIQGFNHPDSIEVNHRWDTSIDTLIGEWHIKLKNIASEKVFITNESDRCVFLDIDHSQEKITDCKEINSSIFSIATPNYEKYQLQWSELFAVSDTNIEIIFYGCIPDSDIDCFVKLTIDEKGHDTYTAWSEPLGDDDIEDDITS